MAYLFYFSPLNIYHYDQRLVHIKLPLLTVKKKTLCVRLGQFRKELVATNENSSNIEYVLLYKHTSRSFAKIDSCKPNANRLTTYKSKLLSQINVPLSNLISLQKAIVRNF